MIQRELCQGEDFWNEESKHKRIEYPINDEIIKKAENNLGIKFPQSFIELMKIQNGGDLNFPYFLLSKICTEKQEFPSIEPIHFEVDDLSILSSQELLADTKLPKEFIVLWTDCHFWIVFDYRNRKDNPSVLYVFENYDTEEITWE
ncbi:SMI1/KNR4 family protein [Lysinibacillus yapensis]|uniref:SMI1/KNR4 family protein n=1 Tax=Ureibacillus yapensis TaxID=2304605 RepID=UPI001F3515AF|nr:SMI1/KNR4 family protein [Lysinibacillus yapensis]